MGPLNWQEQVPQKTGGNGILGGVAAAAPLLGGIISGVSQAITNKKNRTWQEKMYKWQRRDSLADWSMQNAYNSPAQQMQRLKDAGLNPNLVYGHGADAQASSMPRQSNPGSYRGENIIQGDAITQGLGFATDMAIKQQQLRNLKLANAAMASNIVKTNATTANLNSKTQNSDLKYSTDKYLQQNVFLMSDIMRQFWDTKRQLEGVNLTRGLQEVDYYNSIANDRVNMFHQQLENAKQWNTLREAANARANSQNFADLKVKAAQVLSIMANTAKTNEERMKINQEISNLKNVNSLQGLDLMLKRNGFNWTDPFLLRQMVIETGGDGLGGR